MDEERYDIEAKCLHNTREVSGGEGGASGEGGAGRAGAVLGGRGRWEGGERRGGRGRWGGEGASDGQVWAGSTSHCRLWRWRLAQPWRWRGRTVSLMTGTTSSSPPGGLRGGRAAPCLLTHTHPHSLAMTAPRGTPPVHCACDHPARLCTKRCFYPHLTDEGPEVQRGWEPRPGSRSSRPGTACPCP